ncbi:MAG: AAC(3) family N-acetyltransferase [Anaerolineales bacterium]|nr:AAC(3) family N-acetyltransferase [Anaerolineales bacterium]
MLDYPELKSYFDSLNLSDRPVIVHASLKPFGYIRDGADGFLRAMLGSFKSIVMPTFTYWTMVTPEVGPANNAMVYGKPESPNEMATSFKQDLRVDPMMGMLPEALRNHPMATRTSHPILSFAGIHAESILATQTLFDPLAPIGALADQDGWALLINVNHTSNTSIHYAEKLAGRKQFIRWALIGDRTVQCENYPGDSSGFQAIEPYIQPDVFRVEAGKGFIEAIPLKRLLDVANGLIKNDPHALLCERNDCMTCNAVRGIYAVG